MKKQYHNIIRLSAPRRTTLIISSVSRSHPGARHSNSTQVSCVGSPVLRTADKRAEDKRSRIYDRTAYISKTPPNFGTRNRVEIFPRYIYSNSVYRPFPFRHVLSVIRRFDCAGVPWFRHKNIIIK